MFSISITLPKYKFNAEAYSRSLYTSLNVQVRNAAREFLREMVQHIPVDTGQARGTLFPLGRFLNVAVPTNGADPTRTKSPSTGSQSQNMLLFDFPESEDGVYFEIQIQLFYFWFNEFFQHNYPNAQLDTPWESIEAGKKAFISFMKKEAPKRMPKVKDFITVTQVDLTQGGVFFPPLG